MAGIDKRRHRPKLMKHKRHKLKRHHKKTGANANKRLRKSLGLWSTGKGR